MTAYTSAGLAGNSVCAASPQLVQVWLALPAGRAQFDPDRLESAARAEWQRLHTIRRRNDWEVSRALLEAHPVAADRSASMSHAAVHAALALAPRPVRVGVDIEACRPRDFASLARLAFAADEANLIAACADEATASDWFYVLWTLKEASAKALGLSLVDALKRCRFGALLRPGSNQAAVLPVATGWAAHVYAPRPDLRLALVLVGSQAEALPVATVEWPGDADASWPERYRFACPAADTNA